MPMVKRLNTIRIHKHTVTKLYSEQEIGKVYNSQGPAIDGLDPLPPLQPPGQAWHELKVNS